MGRTGERRALTDALDCARRGQSAVLGLVGEPGIGKTALLDDAAAHAGDMRLLRARGVESEAEIPFASLLELLRPALPLVDAIPAPQAEALEGALALRPRGARDRFAVGAATLSLLTAYADDGPVALLIDDAQWLDGSSAQALAFAVRRLIADPIAVLIAARAEERSLIDDAGLPTVAVGGLSPEEAARLLSGATAAEVDRLHAATAGNPLALLELAADSGDVALAPAGAPVLVSERVARAFVRRLDGLGEGERQALLLAATSDQGDLVLLRRAAARLGTDLDTLTAAEAAGLITLRPGAVEFRHPLARSAIYAVATAKARREAHRALAAALPDRDVDRRAWHLASAAAGIDASAAAALEQAGLRARDRSAYDGAAAAFERAGRLVPDARRRAKLLRDAAEASWNAGLADRSVALLDETRSCTDDPVTLLDVDELAGRIAVRRGPVMRGHDILVQAAGRAGGERGAAMLAEAAVACFYAGRPREMLSAAERGHAALPAQASVPTQLAAGAAVGMARIIGGDAAAGARAIDQAIALAEAAPEALDDVEVLEWLAVLPLFARRAGTGRSLLGHALEAARAHAAIGALPTVLILVARDQATTDRLSVAEATYREAIALATESDQRAAVAFGLAGLAWLLARRGRSDECATHARAALRLSRDLGARLLEVWATAALGERQVTLGNTEAALGHFSDQEQLLAELGVTDPDLSPAPELVEAHLRLGRPDEAARVAASFSSAAEAKGQPWSRARALRCRGLVAGDGELRPLFEHALEHHAHTPDAFETARTRLAYGERLRRARDRVSAREQLRASVETFERLDARPWADRARAELRATGETLRRSDPTTRDELTPQELQIAVLLAEGKTTREAAAALFLSPKTIEYHLRHAYQKLGVNSRAELARELGGAA